MWFAAGRGAPHGAPRPGDALPAGACAGNDSWDIFARPADGFVRERGMESSRVQRAFHRVDRLILRKQGESEPAGAAARDVDRFRCLLFDPFRVPRLQAARQAPDMTAMHGRQRLADRDGDVAVTAGQLELLQAGEAANER